MYKTKHNQKSIADFISFAKDLESEADEEKKKIQLFRKAVETTRKHNAYTSFGVNTDVFRTRNNKQFEQNLPTQEKDQVNMSYAARQHSMLKNINDMIADGARKRRKSARYWDLLKESASEQKTISKENITKWTAWFDHVLSLFPKPLTLDWWESPGEEVNIILNELSTAIGIIRNEPILWILYLELLSKRGDENKLREMFAKAVEQNPYCLAIWQM